MIAELSIAFALTFPKTWMGLPRVTDLINMEVQRIELQRLEEEYLLMKESLIIEQPTTELQGDVNPRPSKTQKTTPNRGASRDLGVFTVTCYDLSIESCGKPKDHKYYGITASGFDLKGHSWETARAIAVDPKIIPLGSEVEITFTNENYSQYDGIYIAVDTGGAIKQKKIDFFLGEDVTREEVYKFGKTKAIIKIIDRGGK